MSYQRLTEEEVYGLFEDVDAASSVPVVVYDNPGTTHSTFSDDLHVRIAELPGVSSIKIPPVHGGPAAIQQRGRCATGQAAFRRDHRHQRGPGCADALNAGCQAWYSVLAGTPSGSVPSRRRGHGRW